MSRKAIGNTNNNRTATLTGKLALPVKIALVMVLCLGMFAQNGVVDSMANADELFRGWNHNTNEAASALNVLRSEMFEMGSGNVDEWTNRVRNMSAVIDEVRQTELVASASALSMWRPWEVTHQRLRTIRDEAGWNSWGGGYYRIGCVKTDDNARGFDTYRMGTMIGADYGFNRHWQFGATFGYATPQMINCHGRIDADDVTLGVYSKYNFFDMGTISTFLGYGYQYYKMRRTCHSNGEHRSAFQGDTGYASIEYARVIRFLDFGAGIPLIAIDHQTAWTRKFSETGQWGQTVAGSSVGRTMLRVGLDSKWDMDMFGSFDISTRLHASYLFHGDEYATVTSYFPKSQAAMDLRGVDMGKGQIQAGITASGEYMLRYNWFIDLDGFLTERTRAVQAGIGLSTRW